MNAVATVDATGRIILPVAANEPRISHDITFAIEQYALRGPVGLQTLTNANREEAKAALAYYDRAVAAPRRETVEAWLMKVAAACAKRPDDVEMQARVDSVMETSGDLVRAVWTLETRAQFSRTCKWFPPDADVDAFLRPLSQAFLRKRAALERASQPAPPREAPRPAPTLAEREAVAKATQIARANLTGMKEAMDDPRAAASATLDEHRLLKQYEMLAQYPGREQNACIARAAALRTKLGLPAPTQEPHP